MGSKKRETERLLPRARLVLGVGFSCGIRQERSELSGNEIKMKVGREFVVTRVFHVIHSLPLRQGDAR